MSIVIPPKSKNYSIIAAITTNNVLGSQIIKGDVKKEDYLNFIYRIIEYYEFHKTSQHLIIFADNASIHHAKFVTQHLNKKVTLLFNVSYTPRLNPIEEYFSKLKKLLRKMSTTSEKDLILSLQEAMNLFNANDFKGYIRHVLFFIEKVCDDIDLY